jgi:CheY-like chemotaxis protein
VVVVSLSQYYIPRISPRMSGPTILLVEDNQNDAHLFRLALEGASNDYSLQTVQNGELAIQYLSGTGRFNDRQEYPFPALVILDMGLPQLSGSEVLDWIKRSPYLGLMLVVILSGQTPRSVPGKQLEVCRNVTILNAPFMKQPNSEVVSEIVKFFEHWLVKHLRVA